MGEVRCCGRKMTHEEAEQHKADPSGPCAALYVAAEEFAEKHPNNRLGAQIAFWRTVEQRRKARKRPT